MNCKHTYTIDGKKQTCAFEDLISNLPYDNKGKCIFHSENIEWKRENSFNEYLDTLLDKLYTDNIESFGFYGVHFVGVQDKEEFYNDEYETFFKKRKIKSSLLFIDCVFNDNIEFWECEMLREINFINSVFYNTITFTNCVIKDSLSFYDGCVFDHKLAFYQWNVFKTNLTLINNTFKQDLDIDNNSIDGTLYIEENIFSRQNVVSVTENVLNSGLVLRSNNMIGLLNIRGNNFKKFSNIFSNYKIDNIDFSDNTILGEFRFTGEEDNLLFNPNTNLNLKLDDNKCKIIFDYCNLKVLTDESLKIIKDLEEIGIVILNNTNLMHRFKKIYEVYSTDISDYLIRDVLVLITRLFRKRYSLEIDVNFKRSYHKNLTKIIFSSSQQIDFDKFEKLFTKNFEEIFLTSYSKDKIIKDEHDINEQKNSLRKRVSNAIFEDIISPLDFLSNVGITIEKNKNVTLNFIKEYNNMEQKYKLENNQIKQIGQIGDNNKSKVNFFEENHSDLLNEVRRLKSELDKTEYINDIEILDKAEIALKQKDQKSFLEHITKLGKNALNIGKDIGVSVISDIISKQM